MKNKSLIISLVVLLVAAGIVVAVSNSNSTKRIAAEEAEKQAMMKKEESARMMVKEEVSTKDQEKDKMMTDNNIMGIVMKDNMLFTVWSENEITKLDHDITLKNGTKVRASGAIVATNGSMIKLYNGQELTTDGQVMTVDLSKMMIIKDENTVDEKDSSVNKEMAPKDETMMKKDSASTYIDYSPEVLISAEIAQKSGRKVVLFFHANWCPFCQAADKDFKANIDTDKFPKNVTLIKTDYDSQTELKKKYGVTYQHTFVQIDSNGNQVTKWVSGETSELSTNIK